MPVIKSSEEVIKAAELKKVTDDARCKEVNRLIQVIVYAFTHQIEDLIPNGSVDNIQTYRLEVKAGLEQPKTGMYPFVHFIQTYYPSDKYTVFKSVSDIDDDIYETMVARTVLHESPNQNPHGTPHWVTKGALGPVLWELLKLSLFPKPLVNPESWLSFFTDFARSITVCVCAAHGVAFVEAFHQAIGVDNYIVPNKTTGDICSARLKTFIYTMHASSRLNRVFKGSFRRTFMSPSPAYIFGFRGSETLSTHPGLRFGKEELQDFIRMEFYIDTRALGEWLRSVFHMLPGHWNKEQRDRYMNMGTRLAFNGPLQEASLTMRCKREFNENVVRPVISSTGMLLLVMTTSVIRAMLNAVIKDTYSRSIALLDIYGELNGLSQFVDDDAATLLELSEVLLPHTGAEAATMLFNHERNLHEQQILKATDGVTPDNKETQLMIHKQRSILMRCVNLVIILDLMIFEISGGTLNLTEIRCRQEEGIRQAINTSNV